MQSDISHVQPGWRAIDRSGDKIGDIEQVGSNHFLVTKGLIFVKDVYIPFDAVSSVDPDAETIFLDVDKDDIDSLGWSEPPTMSTDRPADIGSMAGTGAYAGTRDTDTTQDSARLTLSEERLQAGTVRETAGEVAVGKHVVEQQADIDVPVTHDEVEITRRRVDRPMSGDEQVFDDGETIRVPVTAEEVQVSKQARVVEEIEISKRPVTEVRHVSDTVRREEVDLDQTGDVQVRSGAGATTAADRRDAYARDQVVGSGASGQGDDDMLPEAGGALAGGVAGAAVGTAVGGPPGTVVGGAIGAVGGAMAGDAVDSDDEDDDRR